MVLHDLNVCMNSLHYLHLFILVTFTFTWLHPSLSMVRPQMLSLSAVPHLKQCIQISGTLDEPPSFLFSSLSCTWWMFSQNFLVLDPLTSSLSTSLLLFYFLP
jgi:hypothetical protein